uniref:Uncharacterized protein n=1 Tax=Graphocephala atropunctata TaxID=36148 RepID=A0A1B6KL52_9HEMI
MNGRSPNFQNSRFSGGTPTRNQSFGTRQPFYLQPNCNYMSPRGSRPTSPRTNFASPDFIPLGVSSPVSRPRHSWGQRNHSNSSSLSGFSSPPSSNSSLIFSPYNQHGSRGNFRRRGSFNNSNNQGSSSPISAFVDKEALKDPWAELEKKMNLQQRQPIVSPAGQATTVIQDSDSDTSSGLGEEEDEDGEADDL